MPKTSSYPPRISSLSKFPSPFLSSCLKNFSKSWVSSLETSWLAIKARVVDLSFCCELKDLRLLRVLEATDFSTFSIVAWVYIHACYRASAAEIRLLTSYSRSFVTRSLASFEISSHSGSSKVNLPLITASIIYLSFAPLNGGYPQRRM